MYFPFGTEKPDIRESGGMDLISVDTKDGLKLEAWHTPPIEEGRDTILFFHGNARNIEVRIPKILPFLREKNGVLLAEYRGFGGNPGQPTEEGLYHDARAYLDWLISQQGVKAENIVLYGESLGSAVAVQMATEYNVKALILEVPFSSALDLARARYFYIPFLSILMKDQYHSAKKVQKLHIPILIGVGEQDMVVPARFGKKLFKASNPPKTLKTYPFGNHFNIQEQGFDLDMISFLEIID